MKKLFVLVITFLCIVSCYAQTDLLPAYPNEISYRGDIAYYNGSPFTGLLVQEKTNKQLGEFTNGIKNGLFCEYYSNGKKSFEGKFSNGLKDGCHTEWFENGNKKSVINYSNGKYNGLKTDWFENGQQRSSINCKNGDVVDGVYTVYLENGQKNKEQTVSKGVVSKEVIYQNGVVLKTKETQTEYYSDNMKKLEYYLINGKKEGQFTQWYPDGRKKQEGNYEEGEFHGIITSWYDYTQKSSEELWDKGKKNGICTYWNIDGTITKQGNYIDDLEEGKFTELEKDGNQTKVNYKNGEIIYSYDNLVSNFEETENSYLFKTPENDDVFVRFDFLLQNIDEYTQSVIKTIKSNFANTARLTQVRNFEKNSNRLIDYVLSCRNIKIEFENTTCTDSKGNKFSGVNCTINVTYELKDMSGKLIDNHTTSKTTNELFGKCYTSTQDAFSAAKDHDFLSFFIEYNFPIKTEIESIADKNKKGEAIEVVIIGGNSIGINQPGPFDPVGLKFAVYADELNYSIGLIKVKKVEGNHTTCKVIEGGNIITEKIEQGMKLKVVSTNE